MTTFSIRPLIYAILICPTVPGNAAESPSGPAGVRQLLADLVAIPSTAESKRAREVAELLAERLLAAGFPGEDVRLLGPSNTVGGLVARLPGRGTARPVLLLAHLDVVPAVAASWSSDPYSMSARDGYLYGRGVRDNKAGAATIISNLIRLRREGFVPRRDLLAVLTLDEETAMHSVVWLLDNHAPLLDAEFAFNTDAGGVSLNGDKPVLFDVQAAEKMYMTVELRAENPGGHSSVPRTDNAIYSLAAAISRIAAFRFPVNLNEVTRAYFAATAKTVGEPMATAMRAVASETASEEQLALVESDPFFSAQLRTTCVATQLAGGHAENALPTYATAVVNCRILPQERAEDVEARLLDVIADDTMRLRRTYEPVISPASPLGAGILIKISDTADAVFPGIRIVPAMFTAATDGMYTRGAGIPTYGFSAIASDAEGDRSHGIDERISITALEDSVEFWYRLLKTL